ncbi:MAG TPA: hypothetical protein VNA28_03475 [Solirubrobacteraceae bacterium]|nr:hypothetical protein [Solirubrobacteraceae bacterium]
MLCAEARRRAQRAHDRTPLGDALARVVEEGIAQDIALYERMMVQLGFSPRSPKVLLAIAGAGVARLKPTVACGGDRRSRALRSWTS